MEGKVVDAKTNSPLPGSTVAVNGSTSGAITDLEGRNTIAIKANKETVLRSLPLAILKKKYPALKLR